MISDRPTMRKIKISGPVIKPVIGPYHRFKQINGTHSLQNEVPGSFITYQARKRHGGTVAYFNFDLGREVGLISDGHPDQLTPELQKEILNTFSIIIINEYDIINKTPIEKQDILPHRYMATRYLQLQHPGKLGRTSGDGRSIWNGSFLGKNGKTYDVSSCGTGATCLSPATHLKKKFFKSGDPSISYGCGYSEIDEGLSTLFFSEVLNRNHIATERVLAIIEFPGKIAINVRIHQNLIRPSHLFAQLKQGHHAVLRSLVDYYIKRQEDNRTWTDIPQNDSRYDYFLKKQCLVFAQMVAKFEEEYIFCWLDWDGDNILMDGSIIDYGSIRQFGLFHYEYRFDDVDRYSTNILEQKEKAKYILQNLIQAIDFIKTGKKKGLSHFSQHPEMKEFDKYFEEYKNKSFVHRIGFNKIQQDHALLKLKQELGDFRKVFNFFERAKSKKGRSKVADGINWSAVFCMRDVLRELPQIYLARNELITEEEFLKIIKSSYAEKEDLKLTSKMKSHIKKFQVCYMEIIDSLASKLNLSRNKILLEVSMRSSVINKYDRVTGDSITKLVDRLLRQRPKLTPHDINALLHDFVDYQNLDPDTKLNKVEGEGRSLRTKKIGPFKGLLRIVRSCREGL